MIIKNNIKYFALFILFVCSCLAVQAQGTLDKLKFEEAETAFSKKNYTDALNLLEELEAKGLKNPKILHLKILATSRLVIGYRYDFIHKGFKTVETLRKDCNFYLSQYDIEGFEEKYKEVYDISKAIAVLPNTQQEWDLELNKINNKKKQVIQNFVNSLVKVEKGTLYRGIDLWRYNPNYTDAELIEFYKNYGNKVRKIEMDYDFYILPQILIGKEEIIGAVLDDNPDYKYLQTIYLGDYGGFNYYAARLFINALNEKTGKKFRLLREAELDYIRYGGNKYVEEIVEKKIIGGSKRKGYEYEYKYYYTYPFKRNEPDKSTEFGFRFVNGKCSMNILVEGVLDEENYDSFSGKASAIPNQKVGWSRLGKLLCFHTEKGNSVSSMTDIKDARVMWGNVILVLEEK